MLESDILLEKCVIVVGDLNIDLLKHNSDAVSTFVDIMQSLHFTPVITRATIDFHLRVAVVFLLCLTISGLIPSEITLLA